MVWCMVTSSVGPAFILGHADCCSLIHIDGLRVAPAPVHKLPGLT